MALDTTYADPMLSVTLPTSSWGRAIAPRPKPSSSVFTIAPVDFALHWVC